MNNLEVLIPISMFLMIVMIVKIITENRTRQKLIDKGIVDEKAKNMFTSIQDNPLQSLKWGLVLVGIGVALALSQMFPMLADAALMGMMFVFAGIAFLVYYALARKQRAE